MKQEVRARCERLELLTFSGNWLDVIGVLISRGCPTAGVMAIHHTDGVGDVNTTESWFRGDARLSV